MSNMTISLDAAVVRNARIRAIQEGTSVSAKVREFLAQYASAPAVEAKPAGFAFLEAAKSSQANSQAAKWTRADAYDRAYLPSDAASTSQAAGGA
jgi:plasmid stability protein